MPITSYAELKAAVLDDLLRASDVNAGLQFDGWLSEAEAHFRRELLDANMGEVIVDNAVISSEYTALPAGLISLRSVSLTVGQNRRSLRAMSPPALDDQYDFFPAEPRNYAIVGQSIRLIPAPNAAFSLRLVYTGLVPLTALAPTNWMLAGAPDCYKNGCLWMAQLYYKDFEQADRRASMVDRALMGLVRRSKISMPSQGLTPRINAGIA